MDCSHAQPPKDDFPSLVDAARAGSKDALGKLLDECRDYLLLIANRELGQDLCTKMGASDLVQETFVRAQQGFNAFHGACEAELMGWLRQILLRQILGVRRQYSQTRKRDIGREATFGSDRAVQEEAESIADYRSAGSSDVAAEQSALALWQVVESLPLDYRQVIQLRYLEKLKFSQIGERMGRSADAARKLWLRAVEQLERLGPGELSDLKNDG